MSERDYPYLLEDEEFDDDDLPEEFEDHGFGVLTYDDIEDHVCDENLENTDLIGVLACSVCGSLCDRFGDE